MKRDLIYFSVIIVLLAPTVVSGFTHEPLDSNSGVDTDLENVESVTFVSTQGKEVSAGPDARLVAFNTRTKEKLWSHDEFSCYFDVDPINETTLLVLGCTDNGEEAFLINWHTDEIIRQFNPPATHDIDYLGGDNYAAVGANNSAFVYNASTGEIMWKYHFPNHYPLSAGGELHGGYQYDYTHINDIDSVNNGSDFLVSPRNFDRVMLIDRSSKTVEWTLGEEDNYSILYEQHNPVLLSQNPPTVLVADSENNRVIEYQKEGKKWQPVWAYTGLLNWPRDADRLPNGNTLIVDSRGNRVLEVAPNRSVVWELTVLKHPYDVERLELGDEPAGPPMTEYQDEFSEPFATQQRFIITDIQRQYDMGYSLSQWVLPWWIGPVEFGLLMLAIGVTIRWGQVRIQQRVWNISPSLDLGNKEIGPITLCVVGVGIIILKGLVPIMSLTPSIQLNISTLDPLPVALGLLLFSTGLRMLPRNLSWIPESLVDYANYFTLVLMGIFGAKSFSLALSGFGGTAKNWGISVLLLIFTGILILNYTTEENSTDGNRINSNYYIGVLIGVIGVGILVMGIQTKFIFSTYVGPGLLLYVISSRNMKASLQRASIYASLLYEIISIVVFSIAFVVISLNIGLGGQVINIFSLGFLLLGLFWYLRKFPSFILMNSNSAIQRS